jgi:hypothetical protein
MTIHLPGAESHEAAPPGCRFCIDEISVEESMGWLYMPNLKGHKTPKAYLDDQFTFAGEHAQSASPPLCISPHETTLRGCLVNYKPAC